MLGRRKRRSPGDYFESRSEEWRQVGLAEQLEPGRAARARGNVVILLVLIAGVLFLFDQRKALFPGLGTPVQIVTVVALVILGSALARYLGRSMAPMLFRRIEPGTAGVVGFVIRLITVLVMFVVALRIAGLNASALAVGGAFTAVILGLAAQQTLGNLFAGLVLFSARPFRVGQRVRLVGGAMAGAIEGVVSSLGLFYTTLIQGADRVMIPNTILLQLAVVPLVEPDRIELRARFPADMTPADVQRAVERGISVPTRYPPHVQLEELEREEVVVRITATPSDSAEGGKLAGEVLAVARDSTDGD